MTRIVQGVEFDHNDVGGVSMQIGDHRITMSPDLAEKMAAALHEMAVFAREDRIYHEAQLRIRVHEMETGESSESAGGLV
jgi:transaldolase